MQYLRSLFLLGLLATSLFAAPQKGISLSFEIPEGVHFESKVEHEFYTFRWGTAPNNTLFMLHPHPAEMPFDALKPMADMMEVTLKDQLLKQGKFETVETQRHAIELGIFKGFEFESVITDASGLILTQYMFLLHDGERMWNAQISGLNSDVQVARDILNQATRLSNKAP